MIYNGRRSGIMDHLQAKKHKAPVQAASSNSVDENRFKWWTQKEDVA
jgi:hypothetical protein